MEGQDEDCASCLWALGTIPKGFMGHNENESTGVNLSVAQIQRATPPTSSFYRVLKLQDITCMENSLPSINVTRDQ